MAIAVVLNPVNGTNGATQDFGSSGTNRVAFAWQENTTNTIVSPTIGGVSMTQIGTSCTLFANGFGSFWYLTDAGGLGAGSQAVSWSGSAVGVQVSCFSGAAQDASLIDASGKADSQASGSCNVTVNTVTPNCWIVAGSDNSTGAPVATGSLTTQGTGFAAGMAHSNGTVATGAITGGFTFSGGGTGGMNMAKFAPSTSAPTVSVIHNLGLLGVGS